MRTRVFGICLGLMVMGAMGAWAQASSYFDVTEYGAVGDGVTLNTEAIQKAVDTCAGAGGGRVVIPPGKFLTGPIMLKSNINVEIMAGATLLASTDIDAYPGVPGRWEGIERTVYASLFTGHELENVSITGRGLIDAQGEVWWEAHEKNKDLRDKYDIEGREPDNPPDSPLKWPRPRTINLYHCNNVLIRDINIIDSPSWTIHPVYCEDVTVDNVTIVQPYESPNTDGINPDSCRNVRISNCYVDVGDDCVTIKSGYNEDGRRVGIPCENIVVTNCTFAHGRGGVVIGSEMSGDVRNVTVSNCIMDGTYRGLRVKTGRGRGGVVENLRATNLVFRNVGDTGFSVTMGYSGDIDEKEPVTEGTPILRNFTWSNVTMIDVDHVARVSGLPEMPVQNLTLRDVHAVSSDDGMRISTVEGLELENVVVNTREGSAIKLSNVSDVELDDVTTHEPNERSPVILLENVSDAVIRNCKATEGTGTFVGLVGDDCTQIRMFQNLMEHAREERGAVSEN